MKTPATNSQYQVWRSEQLFNIDFACYTLSQHHFSKHFHDHYVIEFVLAGADDFFCAGKTFTAISNQLVLINPGEVHTGNTVDRTRLKYFSLNPTFRHLEAVAQHCGVTIPPDFNFQQTIVDNPILASKFASLFQTFQANTSILCKQEKLVDSISSLLSFSMAKKVSPASIEKHDARVNLLTEYIRQHYMNDICLQQLAALVNLNPFHMLRIFKKATGLSPYEYLLVIRVEQARQLLQKGSKVEQAALDTGFYDSSHFNRMFRKIAGMSPISYRLSKCQYRTSFAG